MRHIKHILGVFFIIDFDTFKIVACECEDLVNHGLFPTSPSQPRMAVSIPLIQLYHALFECSCDAINAFAHALNTFYGRRGFIHCNSKGEVVQDAFCRGFGHAVQWYNSLQVSIEHQLKGAILAGDATVRDHKQPVPLTLAINPEAPMSHPSPTIFDVPLSTPGFFNDNAPLASPWISLDDLDAHMWTAICIKFVLIEIISSTDIIVATDGNFSQWHRKDAGDCPEFYSPEYFLSKEYVDGVGKHITTVRGKPPKAHKPAKVPDEAVNDCEEGHDSGSRSTVKTNMDHYDDGGIMALVCHHDVPLFLANIDTPGEQQKYAVSLIEHLFSLLPSTTTVTVLYDVGCILDRSLNLYDILPPDITDRLDFGTSAMHAYNPRIREGPGLSDGEGVERFWSRLRKMIGVTRTSSIGEELHDDLGDWIWHWLKTTEAELLETKQKLTDCGVPMDEL
ncbi:uncharacterized protein LACBIDRAFT_331575 [Laccaria bicolor S238N-H82]|uniref:Predicted protein n=1 Tax=Laccaria bicolor (strain S238N-H82 / ATCC MYA-4686) TaxID=486041 RepID=B0DPV9_LACBS|nr:uncharacterized protein LACBIDRAFT_331575 [Laccaria bicolor S238N-H82]EDR03523.1 predicted protein [Laccaria bicolor S238N-H82]|eukprot:XP_001885979.1 predicted protein [Laccaria bicolor S238N-H82]